MLSYKDALLIDGVLTDVGATEIMPRFHGLKETSTREKTSGFDLVTDADEAAETVISLALRQAFPSALIIGEEAAGRDSALINQIASADLAFVVDPIDGTKNFTAGLPLFGMMVAATIRGQVVLGAIHDPVCKNTALAIRGEGAWLQEGARKKADLGVSEPVPVEKMDAIAGTNFLPEPMRTTVGNNLSKLALHSWLRCAAHEYRMAAAGHCHLLLYNKLMPWDHAAGWLLHREAGGYSAHFDGSDYLPSHTSGGLLCAPDKESWEMAREALLR